jgi:hypothetical protein
MILYSRIPIDYYICSLPVFSVRIPCSLVRHAALSALRYFIALLSVRLGIILGDLDLIHGLVVKQESRWRLFLREAAFIGVWHILVLTFSFSSSPCLSRDILLICVHHYLLPLHLFVETLRCGTAMYLE